MDSDDAETLVFDSVHQIEAQTLEETREREHSRLAGEIFLIEVPSTEMREGNVNPWATEPDCEGNEEATEQPGLDDFEHMRAPRSYESHARQSEANHNFFLDDDEIAVATIAMISKELAEADFIEVNSSTNNADGDEDGDFVATFLQGSSAHKNHTPEGILPSSSTIESMNDDESIEKFLANYERRFGTDPEEIDRITYYVKQAVERSRSGTTEAQQALFLRSMRQSALPDNVVEEIAAAFFFKASKFSCEKRHSDHDKQSIIDDFFFQLTPPEGASTNEIKKLNDFIKVAGPLLQTKHISLIQEAELRAAATRIGISKKVMNGLLDETEFLQRVASTLSACSSVDSDDRALHLLHNNKFEQMEEIDENDNITAFLSRMSALKEGGHFLGKGEQKKGNEKAAEETEVEIDAHHGFIKKSLQQVDDVEGDWWTNEGMDSGHTQALEYDVGPGISKYGENYIDQSYRNPKTNHPTFSLALHHSRNKEEEVMRPKEKSMEEITAAIENARSARKKLANDSSAISVVAIKGDKQRDPKRSSSTPQTDTIANDALVAYNGFQLVSPSNLLTSIFSGFLSPADRATLQSRKYASKWQNPWKKRWCLEHGEIEGRHINLLLDLGEEKPIITGVAAAANLSSRRLVHERAIPVRQRWQSTYKDRTHEHGGYFNVEVFSLYRAAIVASEWHEFDDEPWEDREVLQNFLHEKSISLSRNWFGDLVRTRGNDRVKQPVAYPKSMEMPMENLNDANEWVEEWYTTWQTRNNPIKRDSSYRSGRSGRSCRSGRSSRSGTLTLGSDTSTEYSRGHDTISQGDDDDYSYSPSMSTEYDVDRYHSSYDDDDDESTWEEPPECGTFLNVKLKIGDRLSRVHPDHTSSLRRSRWRKKYFPRGTFPF